MTLDATTTKLISDVVLSDEWYFGTLCERNWKLKDHYPNQEMNQY